MAPLKLYEYHSRWSFSRGATKGTERTRSRARTDLAEALAEVDGILAGINFLEKVEPTSSETSSVIPQIEESTNNAPPNKGDWGRFDHLILGLPELDVVSGVSPEERSIIETNRLRNHLSSKLAASNDSKRRPRASQWATLRNLRQASKYYYQKFAQATAESTVPRMRNLWKSYDSANDMLETGISTFRNVLNGQIPTNLVDIFALESLSYAISKILHAKGYLKESDILSGILDWRAAIADEDERLTFEDIARQLWPEAIEIMHFIPLQTKHMSPSLDVPMRNESTESTHAGEPTCQGDLLSFPQEQYEVASQATDAAIPLMSDSVDEGGRLKSHAFHIFQETKSHEDCSFSDFADLVDWDKVMQADSFDPSSITPIPPDKPFEFFDFSSLHQQSFGDTNSIHSGTLSSSAMPRDGSPPAEPILSESPPVESTDKLPYDSQLDSLRDTTFFQVITKYMLHMSGRGDLVHVLSGGGLSSKNDGSTSPHLNTSLRPLEFISQALKHIFEPLLRSSLRVNDIFVGIVAMAETFVNLEILHTVREVENYIIAVSRSLTHSQSSFVSIVSETLTQCCTASKIMKFGLCYPKSPQAEDEYSIDYMHRREKAEKEWSDSVFVHTGGLKEPLKHLGQSKRSGDHGGGEQAAKRPRLNTQNQACKPGSPTLSAHATEHCPVENCSKFYKGKGAKNNLSRHIRTQHEKVIMLNCPNCPRQFNARRRDNIRQHFAKAHREHKMPEWIGETKRGPSNVGGIDEHQSVKSRN